MILTGNSTLTVSDLWVVNIIVNYFVNMLTFTFKPMVYFVCVCVLSLCSRPASLTKDRLLASTLVHSVKKEQEFRSIFDHIKLPQASKSTSESFIQHIVSLVHHVKGTLNIFSSIN